MKVIGTYHFLGHQIKEHGVLPKNFMDALPVVYFLLGYFWKF